MTVATLRERANAFVLSGNGRLVIAVLLGLYVPLFYLFIQMGTLRYLIPLPLFLSGPPISLALLVVCITLAPRLIKAACWLSAFTLGVWLLQAFGMTAYYFTHVKQREGASWLSAVAEGLKEGIIQIAYSPYVVVPLLALVLLAWILRRETAAI